MHNKIFIKTQSDLACIKLTGFNDLSEYFANSDKFRCLKWNKKEHLIKVYTLNPIEDDEADWIEYLAIDNSFTVIFNVLTIRTSLYPKTDFKGYKLKLCVEDEGRIPQYEVAII